MPKCQVVAPAFTWGEDGRPNTAWNDTLIYELHVKGFTHLHPEVPARLRGKYAALATPAVIEHLHRLGRTAGGPSPGPGAGARPPLATNGLAQQCGANTTRALAP